MCFCDLELVSLFKRIPSQVVLWLRKVSDDVLETPDDLAEVDGPEEAGVPLARGEVVKAADELVEEDGALPDETSFF